MPQHSDLLPRFSAPGDLAIKKYKGALQRVPNVNFKRNQSDACRTSHTTLAVLLSAARCKLSALRSLISSLRPQRLCVSISSFAQFAMAASLC